MSAHDRSKALTPERFKREGCLTTVPADQVGGPGPSPPLVSVVIPAYNAAAHLGECLDSVLAQCDDLPSEVLVVDDGSTDGTAEAAGSRHGVRVIRRVDNDGPSRARNVGVEAARGEFVAFLDADDLWTPDSLAVRIRVLQQHPDTALVFGDCRQFDEQGLRDRTLFEVESLGAVAWGQGSTVPNAYIRLLADNFITTGSVLVRRAVLSEVGGFADELRLVEDLDLWLRIARRHPIAWCPQVCLLRRRHEDNLSRDPRAMSLAYLEVLRRQGETTTDRELSAVFRKARARELLHLADLALDRGASRDALHWAAASLRAEPGLRALKRMAQGTVMRWVPWPRTGSRTDGGRG